MNLAIIKLIKNGLLKTKDSIGQVTDWKSLYFFARKQQILVMLYYGMLESNITVPNEIYKNFESDTFMQAAISCNQVLEINRILAEFEKNGIEHMALKGSILKSFYPKPEMRQMSDSDILIRVEQLEQIAPIMEKLGFTYKLESDHEVIWCKSGRINIELHKRLIPSYNKDFYIYYGDGWNKAVKEKGKEYSYELKAEDNYIYLFTHFAKHYRDAGVGIKHIVDLYLMQNQIKDMDYVIAELEKLQLDKFYHNVMYTLKVWFEDAPSNLQSETITNRIFSGGAYGSAQAHILSSAVKQAKTSGSTQKAINKKIRTMLFPSFSIMKEEYSILKILPFLLPFVWVWRWITALLFRRDNIRKQSVVAQTLSEESVNAYKDELDIVGLDFNFE
ncbi:MAG: hypothetical protein E7562_04055 [Ruminococcaceae bacterium]|nr:hypothetical protein [Oscillospiraceae bacterium]